MDMVTEELLRNAEARRTCRNQVRQLRNDLLALTGGLPRGSKDDDHGSDPAGDDAVSTFDYGKMATVVLGLQTQVFVMKNLQADQRQLEARR